MTTTLRALIFSKCPFRNILGKFVWYRGWSKIFSTLQVIWLTSLAIRYKSKCASIYGFMAKNRFLKLILKNVLLLEMFAHMGKKTIFSTTSKEKYLFLVIQCFRRYGQKNNFFKVISKQVRTNIGLADTLIDSSFKCFIYMGGTGPCDSSKIIFGNHVYS